jgi:threonine aldolase
LNPNFTSDNVTPASAAILAAIEAANAGCEPSYGGDRHSQRLGELANAVFETEVAIFPVASGTAANALALAQIAPPYGGIYCHETAHVTTDECGAPEFFTGGAKLLGLPSADGKIPPTLLRDALAHARDMGVHHVKPAALSVTQATEWGTVYSAAEIAELTAISREHGLHVHMDGARFANALAHLGVAPAAATWRGGVDVLSLGATKNGALCAEAVVFFDPALAADFARRRKRSGHLWSKMRFLSAQLVAYLENDLWLRNARQANAAATALAAGFRDVPGARVLRSVDANEVFVALPAPTIAALEAEGFGFYRWPVGGTAPDVAIRLVTSYATREGDVAALLRAAGRAAPQGISGGRG